MAVAANTAAGARSVPLNGGTPGATLIGGDFLSVGGNIIQAGYAGAVVAGGGTLTLPLVLPLCRALSNGAAVTLNQPLGTWQIDVSDGINFDFSAQSLQQGVTIQFRQVIL